MSTATTSPAATSPLGTGLLATYCTCILPTLDAGGAIVRRAFTDVQPTFGIGTNPMTGATYPSVASGRPLLTGAIVCRLSTARGTLPDTKVPTTLGNYGIDIIDAIDADMTATEAGMLQSDIDAQVQQEQRIVTSTTTATTAGDTLVVGLALTDGAGPFSLTLAINTLTSNLAVLSAPA